MITPSQLRMLLQEHTYAKLPGTVLTLGRQMIAMTMETAIEVLQEYEIEVSPALRAHAASLVDDFTLESRRIMGGFAAISDHALFRLLGVETVESMDISEAEGCSIVWDLNQPIPRELHGRWEFVLDGGTFDHLFDLKVGFENVSNMLAPGGRLLQYNAASNYTGAVYLAIGPDLFKDYFTLNRFADCKVYVVEGDDPGQAYDWDVFYYDDAVKREHPEFVPLFTSGRLQMTVVIAEKAVDSTASEMPTQGVYCTRLPEKRAFFEEGLRRASRSRRPLLKGRLRHTREPLPRPDWRTPAYRVFQPLGKI
ncbi:MAG: hypothetical protein U0807_06530 [Candidatus Binatia bacterium]